MQPLELSNITTWCNEAVVRGLSPGGCVVAVSAQQPARFFPFGSISYDQSAAAVTPQTVYDIASLTKTMATATAALRLVDQGKLQLDQLAREYLPELRCEYAEQITIRHLLTFTVPFTVQLSALKDLSADEIVEAVLTAAVASPPGSAYAYVNTTSIILGLVLERVSAQTLPELVRDQVFSPLQLTETSFFPNQLQLQRKQQHLPHLDIAPTELDTLWRGKLIQGEVHDESAWKLRDKLVVGSAGLFSTANDVARFIQTFVNQEKSKKPFLTTSLFAELVTNQTPQLSAATALGWELNQPWMGESAVKRLGKTGFTGCTMSFDVQLGKGLVLLSNMIHPRRPPDRSHWRQWVQQLHQRFYGE